MGRLWRPVGLSMALGLGLGLAPAQTGAAYNWVGQVGGTGQETFTGLGTDASGYIYVVGSTTSASFPVRAALQDHNASPGKSDLFIAKLDPDGNTVYATYFGGSADDQATAMAVDASGNIYVTGITYSADFPSTKGSWLPGPPLPTSIAYKGSTFLFKLNSDGTLGYSTFFTGAAEAPRALAVGADGSAYIAGYAFFPSDLPVTPGAYQSTCSCGFIPTLFLTLPYNDGFLARFDPTGSQLVFATYLGSRSEGFGSTPAQTLAIAPDGSAYIGGAGGVFHFDDKGSHLLASYQPSMNPQVITLGSDGSVYLAGSPYSITFQSTRGTFGEIPPPLPSIPDQGSGGVPALIRLDAGLSKVIAATYFGSPYGSAISSLATDSAGNLLVGGWTAPRGLPTVSPLAQGFGPRQTGFVAKASGDLTALQFSGYFGDNELFSVGALAIGRRGTLVLGGVATTSGIYPSPPGNVWVNSLSITAPPPLRIDSVVNAASNLADPLSVGETIAVTGTGFADGIQLLVNGAALSVLSVTHTRLVATLPKDLPPNYATLAARSGAATSNSVLVPVSATSPGLFSQDGSGVGQGYILNADGTLNSPSNPARPGDRITIYATGVGPVSFDHGYAVTASPVNVQVEGFYCNGVAAVMGPVEGFPGDVYQLTVYVPNAAQLVAINPDLANFKFPPLVGVTLTIGSRISQNWLAMSIAQ